MLVGAYEECQACCLRWSCAAAHVIVARCGAAEAPPHVWRWRSGNVRVALARDQTSFLRALAATESLGPALADELESALEAAAAALPRLSGVAGADEHRAALEAGCAALEVLSAAHTGVGVRVGAWVKMPRGPPGGRSVQQRGLVVGVRPRGRLRGSAPRGGRGGARWRGPRTRRGGAHEAYVARGPPGAAPAGGRRGRVGGRTAPARAARPRRLRRSRTRCRGWRSPPRRRAPPRPAGPPAPVLPALRARGPRCGCGAAGGGRGCCPHACCLPAACWRGKCLTRRAQHPTARPVALELRRDALAAHLCSPAKGAPTALLARASAPWPGGGGVRRLWGAGGRSRGAPRHCAGSGTLTRGGWTRRCSGRRRRGGSGMRGDQRRRSEVAASMLAEMTCLPVPLCQFALERENGNSDRAANWLFEHSDTWLAEHPEFAGGRRRGGRRPGRRRGLRRGVRGAGVPAARRVQLPRRHARAGRGR